MNVLWANTCFRLGLFTASPHMKGFLYQAQIYLMSAPHEPCSQKLCSTLAPFTNVLENCVISGFHCDVDAICCLLGYYEALSGSYVPTFRGNVSVPSSRVKKSKKILTLEDVTEILI
jgi:hypothetical protein